MPIYYYYFYYYYYYYDFSTTSTTVNDIVSMHLCAGQATIMQRQHSIVENVQVVLSIICGY